MFKLFKRKQAPCQHKKVESIFRTKSFEYNFYEGFCAQCEESVYGTVWFNGHKVPWTTNRAASFEKSAAQAASVK